MRSESIVEITKSLIKFQSQQKPVMRDSTNPYFNSRYASLGAIWGDIRAPLASNDLALAQQLGIKGEDLILTTLLLHTSGEWLGCEMLITPVKANDPQAIGSAITYARRYSMSALLGISSEDDDDGEAAMKRAPSAWKPAAKPGVKPITKPTTVPVGAQNGKPPGETAGKPATEPQTKPAVKPTAEPKTLREVRLPHKATSVELNAFTSTCQQYGYSNKEALEILGVNSLKEWLLAQPLRRATEELDLHYTESIGARK